MPMLQLQEHVKWLTQTSGFYNTNHSLRNDQLSVIHLYAQLETSFQTCRLLENFTDFIFMLSTVLKCKPALPTVQDGQHTSVCLHSANIHCVPKKHPLLFSFITFCQDFKSTDLHQNLSVNSWRNAYCK